MANALYDKGREGFATGQINWTSDDIRAILIDSADYTVNLSTHIYLSSVPAAARVALSGSFTGKSATNGICSAANIAFANATGDPSEAIIIYKHTGSDGTARLIAWIDTASGLPVTPNGGNINIAWDTGVNKIFRL